MGIDGIEANSGKATQSVNRSKDLSKLNKASCICATVESVLLTMLLLVNNESAKLDFADA